MLSIAVPGNVSLLMSVLLPITQFDILDSEWTTELVLEFDEPSHEEYQYEIPDQTRDLGYETRNSMLNLGCIALFLAFYCLKVVIYFLVLVPVTNLTNKGKAYRQKLSG